MLHGKPIIKIDLLYSAVNTRTKMKPFGFYRSAMLREVKLDITVLRNTSLHIAQLCPLIVLVICATFGGGR
jgi:hypothetical protein